MASKVGDVGEDGEGAVLPGTTDEPITVLSVSAQESREKEDLSNVFQKREVIQPRNSKTLLGPFTHVLSNVS